MKHKTQKGHGLFDNKTYKLYLYFTLEKYSNNNNNNNYEFNEENNISNTESVNISNNVKGQRIIYASSAENTEELQELLEDILPNAVDTLKGFAEIPQHKLYNEFFDKLQVVEPIKYSFKYGVMRPGIMVSYKGKRSVIDAAISRKNSDILDRIAYGGDGDEILGQEIESYGYRDAHRISFELVTNGGAKRRTRRLHKIKRK